MEMEQERPKKSPPKIKDPYEDKNRPKSRGPKVYYNGNEIHSKYLYMEHIENLHDENKKRMGHLEKHKKQIFRKNLFGTSNPIDNYYYPKIHTRSWWPNGTYRIKQRYYHTEIGLEHIYEKKNVEELKALDLDGKKNLKQKDFIKNFCEYEEIKPGQYVITIEFCSSCNEHANITQHSNDTIFKDLAEKYKRIILERFPFIKVFLKPIEVEIVKNERIKLPKVNENGGAYDKNPYPPLNDHFKQCRIGAFEIQISTKNQNGDIETKMIHSKLKTKQFPKVETVLNKIVSYMPKFELTLELFDKEDYEDIMKMDKIETRVYLCNSSVIKEVGDSTEEQVLNFTSPQRRLKMIKDRRLQEKQSPELFTSTTNIENFRTKSARPNYRLTSIGNMDYRRPASSQFNNIFTSTENDAEMTEEELRQQRGPMIFRKFSKVTEKFPKTEQEKMDSQETDDRSESVSIQFNKLPYDTYIIETIENSNFKGNIMLLKFNELNLENNGKVKKLMGLWHQNKAILNVHLYMEKEKIVEVPQQSKSISERPNSGKLERPNTAARGGKRPSNEEGSKNGGDGKTYMKETDHVPISTGTITISNADDPNSRYEVHPNKQAIYYYKTDPGEYKLEITNKDCERVVRKITLEKGLNTINIQLKQEKHCDLVIEVLEYIERKETEVFDEEENASKFKEDGTNHSKKSRHNDIGQENQYEEDDSIQTKPVRNAEIQIFKNGNDLLVEGITNRKGIMKYLVDKNENNLSIKVNKFGYCRAERCFKRNTVMKENANGNYDCTMSFILVKRGENFDKILFISYTNMCRKIFDPYVQNEDERRNIFSYKDLQKEKGIFIATFSIADREETQIMKQPTVGEPRELLSDESGLNKTQREKNEDNNNSRSKNESKESRKLDEPENEFSETTNYEQIVRFGLTISNNVLEPEKSEDSLDQQNELEGGQITSKKKKPNVTAMDVIEYIKDICCEGNIYTPNYDFHINLPKIISYDKITERIKKEEDQEEEGDQNYESKEVNLNFNDSRNYKNGSKAANKKLPKIKEKFEGLYWDLGWLDIKNKLYYETSVYFDINYIPTRKVFFEDFIEFLQVFIDGRVNQRLFKYFGFDNSVLAGSDRYLPRRRFYEVMDKMMNTENEKNIKTKEMLMKQNENVKNKENFICFICNILCGYDEDNNIRDDSISYNLLRKKISSNLKNFEGMCEIEEDVEEEI